ncbi:MAG: FprA family A-type flavoprotein, partial [Spirochaetales bacterium]
TYCISLNDRTTDLFEGLWPISKEGVTYNSYIIKDEKKVIIDLAKAFKTDALFDLIGKIIDPQDIDYLVINHMEPDHTGAIKTLLRFNKKLTILCTPKAKPLLKSYYGIEDRIREAADGETLSIGKHTLSFHHIPFVHWPETMATYCVGEKILFSCDAFGGYGALPGTIFDDECHDIDYYKRESLRYYANIVAKFSKPVLNAIEKLKDLQIRVIAPSHGLIWRKNPDEIISLYKKWAGYADGGTVPGVTLLYGSMYGNTERMMNAVAKGIASTGITVEVFDVARVHPSYILPSLWTMKGVAIGAPTYEGSLFPAMAHILSEAAIKRVCNKKAVMFGSYGWSGGALKEIKRIIEPLKWELNDSLEFLGAPTDETMGKGEEFGRLFAESLK